jgi:uncharacterized membrane protein
MRKPGTVAHLAYLVTIAVKGFDGAVELLVGLLIAFAGPGRIYLFILRLTAPELDVHPNSRVLHAIRRGASGLTGGEAGFAILYLLIHGLLKLGMAVALLRGGARWIYPAASLVLTAFIAYMSWHLAERWSNLLLGFALFDFVTLLLVVNEWVRSGPSVNPEEG